MLKKTRDEAARLSRSPFGDAPCDSPSPARRSSRASRWRGCTPPASTIALVLSQPDRPAGRGMKLRPSPVKAFALEHGIAVAQPRGLRLDGKFADDAARPRASAASPRAPDVHRRRRLRPDPAALAARAAAPRLPQHPCLAAAALARRGADPARDRGRRRRTGVTIMQMDAGLDTGADAARRGDRRSRADDSAGALQAAARRARRRARSSRRSARSPTAALRRPAAAARPASPTPHKIDKAEAAIDWRAPAADDRAPPARLRSVAGRAQRRSPARRSSAGAASSRPGGGAPGRGRRRRRAARSPSPAAKGALALTELQRPGGRRMAAAAFLRGRRAPGKVRAPPTPALRRRRRRLNSGPPPIYRSAPIGRVSTEAEPTCSIC